MRTSEPARKQRVFVSFARDPSRLLPRLFERLEAQDLDVWNYDCPSQSIALTKEILPAIRQQIAESTHFIALVTDRAFEHREVPLEVAWALEDHQTRGLEVAVFVDEKLTRQDWPDPFSRLARFRFTIINLDDRESIGRATEEFCGALKRVYVPAHAESGRVRIIGNVYRELRGALPRQSCRERDTFTRIVRLIERTHLALEAEQERQATELMHLVLLFVEHEYPNLKLRSLRILRAVYLARVGMLRPALDELTEIEKSSSRAELSLGNTEACLHSARAYVHYGLCQFEAALFHYRTTCTLPGCDAADHVSVLICRLRLKERVDIDEEFKRIPVLGDPEYAADGPRMEFAKAIAYHLSGSLPGRAGHLDGAASLLKQLVRAKPRGAEQEQPSLPELLEQLTYVALKRNLLKREAMGEVEELLLEAQNRCPDDSRILRSLSLVYGKTAPAERIRICRVLASKCAHEPESVYEALCGLWQQGAPAEARAAAERFVREHPFPTTPFESYVSGASWWVLGDTGRAEYELKRSAENSGLNRHYREYLGHP